VNPAFSAMSGFTESELLCVGPPYPDWDPAHLAEIEAAFAKTMAGDFTTVQLPFRPKTGELFWVEAAPGC
jgi:PAS domain-containing protein